ncbi:Crp/Fnr family transcriptional regulator [Gaetbulibacter saemankumensis]|uniref:Crp/Fnr family transcriptional regulator n=1 Tax=Gaetbulibacter saemankumensis TaxID=311208 RepID=UPI000416F51F|nr:Crp/Fnr family transcriptional regulator [Gaetbulibacter saemankumensis]
MVVKNEDYLFQILKRNSLFSEISEDNLRVLIKSSILNNLPKRTCILNASKTNCHFHIILAGRVKVYYFNDLKDRKITLFLLTKNDVFDVHNLLQLPDHSKPVFYETLDKTDLICIPTLILREWMLKNPCFYKSLLLYTTTKLKALEEYVAYSSTDDTSTKLARLLLNNLNCSTNKIEHINNLPHKELAQLIGTTRAVINREIQQFKREGIINIKHKNIEITNMFRLLDKINNF